MKKRWSIRQLGLKKWEIALILALIIALCDGILGGTPCCAWWGTVYPELTGTAGGFVPASAAGEAVGVEIRFRIAEWLTALLHRLSGAM